MNFALRKPEAVPEFQVEWEEVECPLCANERATPTIEAPDSIPGGSGLWFAVVQCRECGLCYTNPRPTPESIQQFYPSQYRPHHAPVRPPRRLWSKFCMRSSVDEVAPPRHGPARLLDFGCGNGRYLRRMHRLGWQVLGMDCSKGAVKRVRTEWGLPALVGSLPHAELEPGSFELITMRQSLEHLHDPLAVLEEARRLLSSTGRLLVMCPNIDSVPYRWFGHSWYGLDLPRHLVHFTPYTLFLMLDRAGFRMGEVHMMPHAGWLRTSAQLGCRSRRAPRWYQWLTAKPVARITAWGCALLEQADSICVLATPKESY